MEPGDLDMIEDISLQASHAGISEKKKNSKRHRFTQTIIYQSHCFS